MPTYAYRGNERLIDALEERLAQAGFSREGEPAAAEYVITYCTTMTALEDLYFGDDGLVQTMAAGSIAIDLSPATPSFVAEVSAIATISSIAFVAAPMVVRNRVAEAPFERVNTSCFAASEDDGLERALPLLETLFGDVQQVANVASAQLARAANTIQNTAEMVAAVEVLSLFRSCSQATSEIDLERLVPAATSPEAFFVMNAVKGERFEGAYTVEMLMGELSAAIMCADDYELILPQTEAAFHLFELLAIVGGVDLTPAALALVYEGEQSDEAAKFGLDWQRMEGMYQDRDGEAYDIHAASFEDADGDDGAYWNDDDGMGYADDPDLYEVRSEDSERTDDTSSGFGYSVN